MIPVATGALMMLQRNLLYTAVTRAKQLVVLVGSRKASASSPPVSRTTARTRVKAGFQHALSQSTDQGHCFLPQEQLIADAVKLLQVDTGLVIDCPAELAAGSAGASPRPGRQGFPRRGPRSTRLTSDSSSFA